MCCSPMLQYRGPFVLKMPEEAWFNVNMMQKDMQLALELGRQVDVPLPTAPSPTNFSRLPGQWVWQKKISLLFSGFLKNSLEFQNDNRCRSIQNSGSKRSSAMAPHVPADADDSLSKRP